MNPRLDVPAGISGPHVRGEVWFHVLSNLTHSGSVILQECYTTQACCQIDEP